MGNTFYGVFAGQGNVNAGGINTTDLIDPMFFLGHNVHPETESITPLSEVCRNHDVFGTAEVCQKLQVSAQGRTYLKTIPPARLLHPGGPDASGASRYQRASGLDIIQMFPASSRRAIAMRPCIADQPSWP